MNTTCVLHNIHYAKCSVWRTVRQRAAELSVSLLSSCGLGFTKLGCALVFVSRQFCPVEAEILVRKADILGPPQAVVEISGC